MFEVPSVRDWSPVAKTRPRATEQEFETFYKEASHQIADSGRWVARRLGLDPDEATQELTIRVWEEIPEHDPAKGSAELFVRMRAYRLVWSIANRWRRKRATRELYKPSGDPLEVPDPRSTPPDEAVVKAELCAAVRAALAGLGDRHRRLLAVLYGLESGPDTLPEIARESGVTKQAVHAMERTALRRLAAALAELLADDE